MLTEAELVRTYREHTNSLYAFVSRRVGGDRALAEDIVQDTWLRAVADWQRRGPPDRPHAWLLRVARNLLVSHFRRRWPQPVDPARLELQDDHFSLDTPWAAVVSWGLARLRRRQAELLEAFYFDGKSTHEIASQYGLSERAVEGRLRRARHNLKKQLAPFVGTEEPAAIPAHPVQQPEVTLELVKGGKKRA